MSDNKNNSSQSSSQTQCGESDSGIELNGMEKSVSSCSLSSQNPSHSTNLTQCSFDNDSESTNENPLDYYTNNDSQSSQTGIITTSAEFQADSSVNTAPFKRLTRNVQIFLQATNVARNQVTPLSSNRIKRLASRKSKSIDSRCKFVTKNVILKNLISQYDDTIYKIIDLNSFDRRSKLSKLNAHKLKNLFSNYDNYVTTIYLPLAHNYNLDNQKINVFKNNLFVSKEKNSFKTSLASSFGSNTLKDNDELSKAFGFNQTKKVSNSFSSTSSIIIDTAEKEQIASDMEDIEPNNEKNANEFFTCPMCAHVLMEPITLVCGCTYCKSCLKEYTRFLANLHAMNEMRMISKECQSGGISNSLNESKIKSTKNFDSECYNCGNVHRMNNFDDFKTNTLISQLVEKLWEPNLTVKNLRNEIRSLVVFDLENSGSFKLEKYEYLLQQAYEKDKSNHLILVDLFLINHFAGYIEKSEKYANDVVELKPLWILGYFLKAINNELLENYTELKSNLTMCLKLDPSMEQIKLKLDKVETILAQNECSIHLSNLAKSNRRLGLSNQKSRFNSVVEIEQTNIDNASVQKKQKLSKSNDIPQALSSDSCEEIKYPEDLSKISDQTENEISLKEPKVSSTSTTENQTIHPKTLIISDKDSTESDNSEPMVSSEISSREKKFFIDPSLVKISDFECSLCYILLYKPVTTPCGHSYCSSCLDRSLDHQDKCPLCKSSLDEYLAERRQFTTTFLEKLILTLFDSEYNERKRQYNTELKELSNDENEVPIFVCTLAFPFAPCPLHIYEPRYRLMLRRAIESGSKQFGMCMYVERTPYHFTEYGCMLEIKNYQFTRDGRAIVATVGGRRFRVMKVINRDGYYVAHVNWVSDKRVESEEEKQELQILHDEVYELSKRWYSFIPALQKQKIREIYGISEMPTPEVDIQANDNGPVWHWFLLNILPLDNDFQYKFLTKVSLKERLKQIKRIVLVLMTPVQRNLFSSAPENLGTDRDDSKT